MLLFYYCGRTWVDCHREPAEPSIVCSYTGVTTINSVLYTCKYILSQYLNANHWVVYKLSGYTCKYIMSQYLNANHWGVYKFSGIIKIGHSIQNLPQVIMWFHLTYSKFLVYHFTDSYLICMHFIMSWLMRNCYFGFKFFCDSVYLIFQYFNRLQIIELYLIGF